MKADTLGIVLELFASSKWAKTSSVKFQPAVDALAGFEDELVIEAVRSLRSSLARTFITVEELAQECRRKFRQANAASPRRQAEARAQQAEYLAGRKKDVERIRRARREEIAQAIQLVRETGITLKIDPDEEPERWSRIVIGFVAAALDRVCQASGSELFAESFVN